MQDQRCKQDISMRTSFLAIKWMKNPPKPPQLSTRPKGQQRTGSTPHNLKCFEQQANKHQPSSIKVNKEKFESTTTFRTDYVAYPVQPRKRTQKSVHQSQKDLISGSTQIHEKHLSTTHADFKAHKCERVKPIRPTVQNFEKSTEPFQTTTTMREDFKAWNVQRRRPIIPKQQLDWLNKPENPRNNRTTSSLHPERRETVVCNITHRQQAPAESEVISSFQCILKGDEESRMFWTTSVGRGVDQAKGAISVKPCEDQQMITCMFSSKVHNSPETRLKKKHDAAASSQGRVRP